MHEYTYYKTDVYVLSNHPNENRMEIREERKGKPNNRNRFLSSANLNRPLSPPPNSSTRLQTSPPIFSTLNFVCVFSTL